MGNKYCKHFDFEQYGLALLDEPVSSDRLSAALKNNLRRDDFGAYSIQTIPANYGASDETAYTEVRATQDGETVASFYIPRDDFDNIAVSYDPPVEPFQSSLANALTNIDREFISRWSF